MQDAHRRLDGAYLQICVKDRGIMGQGIFLGEAYLPLQVEIIETSNISMNIRPCRRWPRSRWTWTGPCETCPRYSCPSPGLRTTVGSRLRSSSVLTFWYSENIWRRHHYLSWKRQLALVLASPNIVCIVLHQFQNWTTLLFMFMFIMIPFRYLFIMK